MLTTPRDLLTPHTMEIVTKSELFNLNRAIYILDHWNELIDEISPNCHMNVNDMRKNFEKYVGKHGTPNEGIATRQVSYRQKFNNQGRFFSEGALSLQSIARGIRQSISDGLYVDVDIVNAHPCILMQMMQAEGLECTFLSDYVNNRQERLRELQLSFNTLNPKETMSGDQAKKFILTLINGGQDDENVKTKEKGINAFTKGLAKEMRAAHTHFAKSRNEAFEAYRKYKKAHGKDYNFKASWMNHLICDAENKALNGIRSFFDDDPNLILCFDGAMVPKDLHDSKIKKNSDGVYDYEEVQAKIMTHSGMDLTVKDKPFEFILTPFTNGTEIPVYKPKVYSHYNDYTEFSGENKEFTLDQLNEWSNKCFAIVDGDGFKKMVRYKRKFQRLGNSVQENTYIHIMNYKHAIEDIDSLCNVVNPDFDLEFYEKYKDSSASNPNRKMSKFQRHKFTNLREYISYRQSINQLGPKYNSVEFTPYLKENTASPDALNLFAGYPHANSEPSQQFDFKNTLTYRMILNNLCNSDINECEHFLDTLADIIQDPTTPKRNGHIFVGPEGSGKGTMAWWLANVFGHNNVASISNVDRYFEKFNSATSCKLIKILEENSEEGSVFKYADRLKAQITEPEETTESKGQNPISVANCARFILFSNHKNNVAKMEGGNTRMTLHESNPITANNKGYFEPIYEEIANKQFQVDCFHWLANKNYDKLAVHGCFNTAAKDRQVLSQLKTGYKFLVEFIEREFVTKDWKDKSPEDRMFRFPISTLNNEFKQLYSGSRNDTFDKQLKEIGITAKNCRTHARGNEVTRCITLHPPAVEAAIRKQTKVESFSFDFSVKEEVEESAQPASREEILEKIKIFTMQLERAQRQLEEHDRNQLRIRSPEPSQTS